VCRKEGSRAQRKRAGEELLARLAKEAVFAYDVILDGMNVELDVDVGVKADVGGRGQVGDGRNVDGVEQVEDFAPGSVTRRRSRSKRLISAATFFTRAAYSGCDVIPSEGRSLFQWRMTL